MKRKILFMLTALLIWLSSFSQETRELNWQKFSNSIATTEIIKPVKNGKFTIFQISDINKFLYKVEIAGKVFELQTPIPTELQSLFRLSPVEQEKKAGENKAAEGDAKIKTQIPVMQGEQTKLQEVKSKIEKNENNSAFLQNAATPQNDKDDANVSLNTAIASLKELVAICKKYSEKSGQLSKNIFELKSIRRKLISISQMDKSYSAVKLSLDEITLPYSESIKSDYSDLKSLYAKVEAAYNDAESKTGTAANKIENIYKVSSSNSTVEKINTAKDEIEKADELIDEEAILGLLEEVDYLYQELSNKNNFIVVAPPVQMDGDFVTYSVTITPSTTRILGPNRNPMHFKFDIPASGGLKVDFSVGPVISFGKNSKDEKYFLETIPTFPDSVKIKKQDNNNVISPGIAALMHLYFRSEKKYQLGGLFGVGAGFQSISDINLSLFTGVSLVMGKREKVMLSLGASWLKVDRLKNNEFNESSNYAASKISLGNITEKVFKVSGFFSVSYNLTNKVEIK